MQTDHGSCRWTVFFILLVFAAVMGCAGHVYLPDRTHPDSLPAHREIAGIPFYPQKDHQCGPAALAMVLTWSGCLVASGEVADEIYTPGRKGSLQPLLVSAARFHGRLPYVIRDFESLLQEAAAGHPVIVLQNLGLSWYPRWHYAVVIGYDTEKRVVILRSGEVFREELSWPLFLRTWERAGQWGLVVLPLTELPASANEASYLAAALALENVNNWEAASTAYGTALTRWPESLGALMGLGNSRYALGDMEGAEKAFRRAVEICVGVDDRGYARGSACGDAYNNLSHVLAGQKRYDAALMAAQEAVRLGGPNEEVYRQTLEEIMSLKKSGGTR